MLVYQNDLTSINAGVGNNSTLPVIGDADYDRTVVNDAGNTVAVPAEAVRSHGMRIAENLISLGTGYSVNSGSITLQDNGTGELTGLSQALINYFTSTHHLITATHGYHYCVRLELKAVNVEAVGKKVRFLLKRLGAGTYTESQVVVTLTDTYQTYSTYINLNPDNVSLQFAIFSYGDTDSTYVLDTDTISVRNLQIEATENHVIQDKPSEFVSRDVGVGPELADGTADSLGTGWVDEGSGAYSSTGVLAGALLSWNIPTLNSPPKHSLVIVEYEVYNHVAGDIRALVYGQANVAVFPVQSGNGQYRQSLKISTSTGSSPNRVVLQPYPLTFEGKVRNVSVKVVDHGFGAEGYKLFDTAKGTTVDANSVVTDAVGAPLAESTLLGYVSEGPTADGLVIPIDLEAL